MSDLTRPSLAPLTKFDFRGNSVRVVTIDGEPWFVAKDVTEVLGLGGYPSDHTSRLAKDELTVLGRGDTRVQNPRDLFDTRSPTVSLISESGLYKLTMRSDKPDAKAFQDWVTREVLPSIRKHGIYVAGQEKVRTGALSLAELGQRAAEAYKSLAEALQVELDKTTQQLTEAGGVGGSSAAADWGRRCPRRPRPPQPDTPRRKIGSEINFSACSRSTPAGSVAR